jgi:N-acetylglucosamine malate deacetylase 2
MKSSTLKSVVGIFAHPDDETILAGGLFAMLAKQGINTHLVSVTRGEGGELGQPPVVSSPDQLGAARERELRCAARALGAGVTILDYVDPRIGPDEVLAAFEADFETLASQLAGIIRDQRANLVLTHGAGGEYGHPAHQLVHQAVMHVVCHLVPEVLVYTVAAEVSTIEDKLANRDEPAHLALDIRPWSEAKLAAMECHVSQHALFKRDSLGEKSLAEIIRTIEAVRRVWPARDPEEPPRDAFAQLLRTVGAWTPETRR